MAVTYSTLRQNLMKLLNISRTLTATSPGAAARASYISTDARKWDGGNDDHYNGMWLVTTSGTTKETVFVSDYATATGTFTPRPSFSAQIANAVTAEVMPWEPSIILDAFQRAIDQVYPNPLVGRKGLFKTIFEEMVTNSWIWNGHFEDWTLTTIPDHYQSTGGVTVTEETGVGYVRGPLGSSAMKITGGATGFVSTLQQKIPGLLDLAGQTVTFEAWAYAGAASKARISIYAGKSDNTSEETFSSYHTGGAFHELLTVEATLPSDLADIWFCFYNTGATVYYDNARVVNGPYVYKYHMSKDFLHDPLAVEVQINDGNTYGADMNTGGEGWELLPYGAWHIEDDGTNRILVLHRISGSISPYAWMHRRKLRITGNETLTVPTTDASTVEVSGDQMRALVALAASELMLTLEGSASAADAAIIDYKGRSAIWRSEAERLLVLHGRPMPINHISIRG